MRVEKRICSAEGRAGVQGSPACWQRAAQGKLGRSLLLSGLRVVDVDVAALEVRDKRLRRACASRSSARQGPFGRLTRTPWLDLGSVDEGRIG